MIGDFPNWHLRPNVCPGCGRCRECGQPAPQLPHYGQPIWEWQPFSAPYVGDTVPLTTTGIVLNTSGAEGAH